MYAPLDVVSQNTLWVKLSIVISSWPLPCRLGSDFNTVRFSSERIGMHCRFSNFISRHSLIYLQLEGAQYIWSNNQDVLIMSQLDRLLLSASWIDHFGIDTQCALPNPYSNHLPILVVMMSWGSISVPFRNQVAAGAGIQGVDQKMVE